MADKLIEASSYVDVKLDNIRQIVIFFISNLVGLSLACLRDIDGLGPVTHCT